MPRVANGFLYKAVLYGEATNVFMLRRGFSLMVEFQSWGASESVLSPFCVLGLLLRFPSECPPCLRGKQQQAGPLLRLCLQVAKGLNAPCEQVPAPELKNVQR